MKFLPGKGKYNSSMGRFLIPLLIGLGVVTGILGVRTLYRAVTDGDADIRAALEEALDKAVEQNTDAALPYVVFDVVIDRLVISEDGQWAVLWVAAYDRENDEPFGMEPGLGIAHLENGEWRVFLPSDPEYLNALNQVPDELLPKGDRVAQQEAAQAACNTSNIGPFTGYKLPWPAGMTLYLTQSIFHTLSPTSSNTTKSMLYAFDFSTSPSNFFEVRAARPGTVKYVRDSQVNNDPNSPGNYIVLEDTGTNPTSYQLYLHLAQGSIPANLKTIGAQVQQGQLIGVADDTGVSSNHHLHFQVHTEVAWFGCSVDVRFSDVAINQGRPRLPTEAQQYPQYGSQGQYAYVSGNTAPGPGVGYPEGGIIVPELGTTLDTTSIALSGYAYDFDNGLVSAQFAVDYGDGWQPVGQLYTVTPASKLVQLYDTTLDMCAESLPDGPLKFGMITQDVAGNISAGGRAVPVIKRAACAPQPPACIPAANQAAVYSQPDYTGDCQVFSIGSHVTTPEVRSIIVGTDVSLSLYFSASFSGRSQTFIQDDANLANDRSPESIEAAIVKLRTDLPGLPSPSWPAANEVVPLESSVNLYWHDGGGSTEFQARLVRDTQVVTSTWLTGPLWDPGPLAPGTYSYTVRARNAAGTTGWSSNRSFTVVQTDSTTPPAPVTAPWSTDFESGGTGWYGTGLWNLLSDGTVSYNGTKAWWYGTTVSDFTAATYNTGKPTAGSLTSPPVTIPGSGYYLRFYSRFETEENGLNYDRRRVLISADGGPFVEVYQLDEAVKSSWRRSPYIDLAAFAGKTIRVRFAFESLDRHHNDYDGWLIDQVTIDKNAPGNCGSSTEPDDNPASATLLAYGGSISTELCPVGDVDYYKFTGTTGDRISLDVDARVNGSPLDSVLVLYDADGVSVLAEMDDEVPGKVQDPILGIMLPRTGTYYVKIRDYNHPGTGTNAYAYTLRLSQDQERPVISAFTPSVPLVDISSVPAAVTLQANVSDVGTGVRSVRFLYHSGGFGWMEWVVLGVDTDGSDGWSAVWDTVLYPAEPNMILIAQAYDSAGNSDAVGLWSLFPLEEKFYIPITIR